MRKRQLNYTKAVIIVHGKSELHMCKYIKKNLRLKVEIESEKKGEKSIQISGLINFLQGRNFSNLSNFIKKYDDIEVTGRGQKRELKNFKIFMIMDTDDCTLEQAKTYKDKSMFKNHWAYDYIEPIYNHPNLDMIVQGCGLAIIKDKNRDYLKIFPIDHDYQNSDAIQIEELTTKFSKDKNTNLDKFLEYCLQNKA